MKPHGHEGMEGCNHGAMDMWACGHGGLRELRHDGIEAWVYEVMES